MFLDLFAARSLATTGKADQVYLVACTKADFR
jgi:hypothetical protein